MEIKLDPQWKKLLKSEFNREYFKDLVDFVRREYRSQTVYPSGNAIFNALNLCPVDQVKVVIIGQDPYHGPGQANGLAFSVSDDIKKPPSLVNIFKEIQDDLGVEIPESGNLERWAKQGVLLLNTTLTVRKSEPASHQGNGWEIFTDAVIKGLTHTHRDLVYMLWGKFAQDKSTLINSEENFILKAPHPSPFSAHKGFFGCQHFSKANKYLVAIGEKPIEW